jgi:hypothetical protein
MQIDPDSRRLIEAARQKQADMNRWVGAAKGGNPHKLVSARDALKHAFAEIGRRPPVLGLAMFAGVALLFGGGGTIATLIALGAIFGG